MQELHLVGITTDRQHLIFSIRRGAKSGSYLVAVGEDLREVVDELADELAEREAAAEASPPRPDARLSVREMQTRLRAGAAVAEVATAAGVDEDWVERFATPVRAEQRRMVELARTLPMVRARAGVSAEPLGVAVARAMGERGVTFAEGEFDAAWGARMTARDQWEVDFSYTHRNKDRTVTWVLDLDEQHLTTSDRSASQIGFVAPDETPAPSQRQAPSAAASRRSSSSSSSSSSSRSAPSARRDVGSQDGESQRSTRGDGRPDTAPSTEDVRRARKAAAGRGRRPAPKRVERAESEPEAPEPEPAAPAPDPATPTTEVRAAREPEPIAPAVVSSADAEAVPPPFVPATDDVDTDEVDTDEVDTDEVDTDEVDTDADDDDRDDPDGVDEGSAVEEADGEPDDEVEEAEPQVAFEFSDDVEDGEDGEDGDPVETVDDIDADADADEDLAIDAAAIAPDDEPASDGPEAAEPAAPEPPRATARFRSGAAIRAGDVERHEPTRDPAPEPDVSEPVVPDPWAATPETDTPSDHAPSDDARARVRVRARPVRIDDEPISTPLDEDTDPSAAPPSSNGRPRRRRRTRPLRAR